MKIIIKFNDETPDRIFKEAEFVRSILKLEYVTGFVEIKERYEYRSETTSFPSDKIREIIKEET